VNFGTGGGELRNGKEREGGRGYGIDSTEIKSLGMRQVHVERGEEAGDDVAGGGLK
jgi:hypothetical protein